VSTLTRGAIDYPASRQSLGAHSNVVMRAAGAAAVGVLAVWVLNSVLLPLLVAAVTAIASWPLYSGHEIAVRRRGNADVRETVLR